MKTEIHENRLSTNSNDKSFARAVLSQNSNKKPHLQWIKGQFQQKQPPPAPMMQILAMVMHSVHAIHGRHWRGSRNGIFESRKIEALGDTGCQTCTAGENFLERINCPHEYLIPTRHRIVGITDDSLGIIGAVFVRIDCDKRTPRQMIYISTKVKGLFLSKSALKDL